MSTALSKKADGNNFCGFLAHYFKIRYQFPPGICEALAQDVLRLVQILSPDYLEEGQILRYVVSITEPPGKLLKDCKLVPVKLTLYAPEDKEYRRQKGLKELKLRVIQRITQEAIAQGGSLSQEDIADLLFLDRRTVVDYIKELESRGVKIITRAKLPLIFRGTVDKLKMIKMFLKGSDEAEIASSMRCSEISVKSYIERFLRVSLLYRQGIAASTIVKVTDISLESTKECIDIYHSVAEDEKLASFMHKIFSFYEGPGLLEALRLKEQLRS